MTASTHPVEREQLMAYLDGELAANEAARVAAHLTECAECRQLEADLRSVSTQMLTWNVEPASPQISEGVRAALRANPSHNSAKEPWNLLRFVSQNRIRVARWTLAAACVGVAAMILVKVYSPARKDEFKRLELSARIYPAPESLTGSASSAPVGRGAGGTGRGEGLDEYKRALPRPMPQPVAPAPPPAHPAAQQRSSSSFGAFAKGRAYETSNMNGNLVAQAPMIARTASLKISAKDFQSARAGVDRIIATFHGFAASMSINNAVGEPQSLNAELHFPAAQCDAALSALKALGRVEQEQQGGEEVTAQVVDLDARPKPVCRTF